MISALKAICVCGAGGGAVGRDWHLIDKCENKYVITRGVGSGTGAHGENPHGGDWVA